MFDFDRRDQELIEIALTHLQNTFENANKSLFDAEVSSKMDMPVLYVQGRYMPSVDEKEIEKLLNKIQEEGD